MKVKCIANTNKNLLKKNITQREEIYPIEIGKKYVVYAISMWKGNLYYLLDTSGLYHAELFKIINHLMPNNWYFNFNKKNEEFNFGYKEFVLLPSHYESLVENEAKELSIFRRRKKEIDEYENLLKTS